MWTLFEIKNYNNNYDNVPAMTTSHEKIAKTENVDEIDPK